MRQNLSNKDISTDTNKRRQKRIDSSISKNRHPLIKMSKITSINDVI